ncbi:MAG: iron ABC transporter permease [Myxococcota bacterium]
MIARAHPGVALGGLGVLLLGVAVASLMVGALPIALDDLLRWAAGFEIERSRQLVLSGIRLPRVLLGVVVGASLGTSGALLQGLFRNPLASPALLGVSSGASTGAAVAIVLFGTLSVALPLAAFAGGLLATGTVLWIATREGRTDTASLLLAGIAVNAVAGAATGLLVYLSDEAQLRTLVFFTLGSLGGAAWDSLVVAVPLAMVPVLGAPWLARSLDALLLGEPEARHLGVDVQRTKAVLVGLVCVGVGACVAVSGTIGFVGLAVPHLVRMVFGPGHRTLVVGSALVGAALLVGADTVSRTVVAPAELPIGILTTLLGGPFFLALLHRARWDRP